MTAVLAPQTIQRFFDNNGAPLAGGFVYTYAAGTSTPQASYVDSTQTTQNTNPIQLNFRGECPLWLDPTLSYKLLLTDAAGNQIPGWPVDNIAGPYYVTGSLIPHPTNTWTLGSQFFTWANLYLGTSGQPLLDPVTGNILFYARTAAEISAGITPTNFSYPPGHVFRYCTSAQVTNILAGTLTLDVSGPVQLAMTVSKGYLTNARTTSGSQAVFPAGAYLIQQPVTVPFAASVRASADTCFFYDDTANPGSFAFTCGAANTLGGGFVNWDVCVIFLQTVTAGGLQLIDAQQCDFGYFYVQGKTVAMGSMSSRTNVGLLITSDGSNLNCFNNFDYAFLNHCHTGVRVTGTDTTQQTFGFLRCFGDFSLGDTSAIGLLCEYGSNSVVQAGYFESYGNISTKAAIVWKGVTCLRWRINNVTFDDNGSGTMNALWIYNDGSGIPTGNRCIGSQFFNTIVTDNGDATWNNYIEGRPDLPGATWTATLVCGTSGTITLNAGIGGSTCYSVKRGREVRVFGTLVVASVSAPTGTLRISGLPWRVWSNTGSYAAASIHADGLQATATTAPQAFANQASTDLYIDFFSAGVASTTAAAQIKAGSQIMFNCSYITDQA